MANVLVVYTHPVKSSFNRAILAEVEKGLAEAGHSVQVADLYAEGFQCAMTEKDFGQFEGKPPPADILKEQARVEWSDAIIFIFPMWWWSLPAMLKGWIDRVMSYGWGYVDPYDPDSSHLKDHKVLVLTTASASKKALEKRGYDKAFHAQLNVGIFDYCGIKDVATRIFYELDETSSEVQKRTYLDEARALARSIIQEKTATSSAKG